MTRPHSPLALSPSWELLLQGTMQLIADKRARSEGIPLEDVSRLIGIPVQEIGKWVEKMSVAGPEDADPTFFLDAFITKDRFYILCGPALPGPTRLNVREILALLTLIGQVDLPESGTQLGQTVENLKEKLLTAVAPGVEDDVRPVQERVRIQPEATVSSEHLAILDVAVKKHLMVDLEYYSREKVRLWRRKVRPFLLLQHLGIWYVIVDEKYRLRVECIKSVKLTSESYEPPADFDLERFRTKVMFEGEAKHEILLRNRRKTWPIRTASPRAVRGWALRSGGKLVIDGPKDEREKLLMDTREILKKYSD